MITHPNFSFQLAKRAAEVPEAKKLIEDYWVKIFNGQVNPTSIWEMSDQGFTLQEAMALLGAAKRN